jgi:hypothetical protein
VRCTNGVLVPVSNCDMIMCCVFRLGQQGAAYHAGLAADGRLESQNDYGHASQVSQAKSAIVYYTTTENSLCYRFENISYKNAIN